jgi:hypothetical protein
LITPSGIRIPFEIPHYTKEYCAQHGIEHRTTADSAADMVRSLPLPPGAEVVVLGDTAYDAQVLREACEARGYLWIFPANPERVYEGPTGQRPQLRSRLKNWSRLSLQTVKLRASTGEYARYRRLSKWRVGLKQKPRVYYAYQEKRQVRRVGSVLLVFSTMKPNLAAATPDDVKILMTNAVHLSVREVIELYSLRWQIELFFKELKSTLGFSQYRFQCFQAVKAWVEAAIVTVLFLEHLRADRLSDRRLSKDARRWWEAQRLHGLSAAFRQECNGQELKYLSDRLKTSGGIAKLKRLLAAAGGEHAGQDRAQRAADAVHAEGVERVVVAEGVLELRAGEEADDAGRGAHRDRRHRLIHETGGGRDADQARHRARAGAQSTSACRG